MERLQKYLSRAGVASRRKAETMISNGQVSVNDVIVTELGTKVAPGDLVKVDGVPVTISQLQYFLVNKPPRYVTTNEDNFQRAKVVDLVPCNYHIWSIGRLDYHSEGLIILTNDGELTAQLIHPRSKVPKVYRVEVSRNLTGQELKALSKGVELEGKLTAPATFKKCGEKQLEVILTEGRNRQIRKMLSLYNVEVKRLQRIAIDFLELGNLKPGQYRHLTSTEVARLKQQGRASENASRPGK